MNKSKVVLLAVTAILGAAMALMTMNRPSEAGCKAALRNAWIEGSNGQKAERNDACDGLDEATQKRLIREVVGEQLRESVGS